MRTREPAAIDLGGPWEFGYLPALGEDEAPAHPGAVSFVAEMPVPAYWDDVPGVFDRAEIAPAVIRNPDFTPIDYKREVTHEMYVKLKSSLPYVLGVGYYRRSVDIPADWAGGLVALEVGGVTLQAWVWVNGEPAGHHVGHSTAFTLEVQDLLRPGEANEIVIAVTNLGPERGGLALEGFKGRTAGIHRPVRLRRCGPVRIADCYVCPDAELSTLSWRVELSGPSASLGAGGNVRAGAELRWQVVDPAARMVVGSGSQAAGNGADVACHQPVEWNTDSLGMSPWSDRDARLYRIELELVVGDEIIDRHSQRFGLRRMTRDGVDLLLNGAPIFLRGVTDHCYWAATCNPPADKPSYLDMLRRHRELGFNWIRFHTWVPSEPYMAAADELGMLLMVEAPRGFERDEWLDILRTCRRHPSVVIYSGGNEECLDEARIEMLAEMAGLQKRLAPDALFNPQEALRGVEYCWGEEDYGDNVVTEPFKHNPTRLARLKEFSDVFGQYSWKMLSYELVKADRHDLDRKHAYYGAPLLAHEISIKGSYIDFDLEHRMAGTRIGTGMYESAREVLTDAGLYHNAALYYRNSCAWLRIFRKHVIEMARKCRFNRGYDLLGGHDHHVQSQGFHGGLMNDFFELKPGESVADVRQYNGESALLLDTSNDRNLRPGDEFALPLLLSFYSRPDIREAQVSWHVRNDAGRVVARGEWEIGDVAGGTLTDLGSVRFTVPEVAAPTKLRLVARLSSADHELTNDWDYWAFPEPPEAETPDDVRVVTELTEADIDALEQGARVVLLGAGGLPHRAVEHQITLAGRARGNLATVINDHPITNRFPHDGWASWQFNNLLNGSAAVVFNDLNVAFDPIIEVVSSYKLIRKQACLFEVAVGAGRLIVCTMNLTGDDAGTAWMKHLILAHAADDAAARPGTEMDPAILRHYAANPSEDVAVLAEQAANANREGNAGQ